MGKQISQAEFLELAEAASKNGNLKSRRTDYGTQFGVFLNGRCVATSTPDANGNYIYEYLM